MDNYKIQVEPDWDTITVTGGPLEPFALVPGAVITDSQAILPFTPETADILYNFLIGKSVTMTNRDKRYLRVLKDREHVGKADWVWSLDLYTLKDEVINQRSRTLRTKWDLIHNMPLRYIDKSNPQNITDLELDSWAVVVGEIITFSYNARADAVILTLKDITGATITSWFFRQRWMMNRFSVGETVVLSGTYSIYTNKYSQVSEYRITNATIDKVGNYDSGHKVAPVYSEKGGKKKWTVLQDIERLISNIGWIEDPVPESILEKYGFMTRNDAYRKIHFPDSIQEAYDARQRIAFDDFVRLQVLLKNKKTNEQEALPGTAMEQGEWAERFVKSLPFEFTGAQKRVTKEIAADMSSNTPMRRLLHGDVGSGKAQPLYSQILTPTGFVTMGDIAVGDTVLTPKGGTATVVGLFPQGKRPIYELVFEDGSVVHADAEHIWAVGTLSMKESGEADILLRTAELQESLSNPDGTPQWHVDQPLINGLAYGGMPSAEAERLRVLTDLLDTLGEPIPGRRIQASGMDVETLKSTRMLIKSLGGFATQDGETVIGRLPAHVIPFASGSRRAEYEKMPFGKPLTNAIVSITYIGEEEAQCIKLDDPEGLYITDEYIVTHNTELATTAVLRAVESGKQVAVLAPTSILASQLKERFDRDLIRAGVEINSALFINGMRVKPKREMLAGVQDGSIHLLVGTHSILSKDVVFKDLGLIVIDEQHKFGTKHRQALADNFLLKSEAAPDTLMMSATPIPRTMSQTIYGDMDLSVVDEYPADRKPVLTYWDEDDIGAWEKIREEVAKGHQAYVIAALVEESESEKMENVENATETHAYLQSSIFPDLNVGLVHGKMKAEEKEAVLRQYYNNEIQVLVSTSVIEVGVNVPNATVMTILNANRFGIASLHQIRGRVGRGGDQGYCFLVGHATNPDAEERLNALVISNDGFWLAEKDLEIRGEGSLLKDTQHGQNDMIVANLREHRKILDIARRVAGPASKSVKLQKEVEHLFGDGNIST